MKTMSAIYQKVRHRLNDDWAYGNGESIGHFQKYHNTLCVPSKILHKYCFQFLFDLQWSQEKMKTMLCKIWEGNQRILWYFFIFGF